MCIGRCRKIIISFVQHVRPTAIRIIRSKVALIHIDFQRFTAARLQHFCFSKSTERHCRFLHFVFYIILRIRRLYIHLYGFLSCIRITGVRYRYGQFKPIRIHIIMHGKIIIRKIRIAQSISKRKCNVFSIIIITCISFFHDIIFIACLIILITYINTFLINHIGACFFRYHPFFISFVYNRYKVSHCRCGVVIIAIRIYQTAGRIHLSCQYLADRINTRNPHISNPQTCIHIVCVIFQKIYLQCIRGVNKNYNLFDGTFRFHSRNIFHHFSFVFIDCKIIHVPIIQVRTFSANTG